MATLKTKWTNVSAINPRIIARNEGFDLDYLSKKNITLRAEIKKLVTSKALALVADVWKRENGTEFAVLKRGVYVISLASGLSVRYPKGSSNIVYIGRGNVSYRLKRHFLRWIIEFSSSISDISFEVAITKVRGQAKDDYYKDAEKDLIDEFTNKFGEKPLVNKINGKGHTRMHQYAPDFFSLLNNVGKKYLWEVRPLERNPWFREMNDS